MSGLPTVNQRKMEMSKKDGWNKQEMEDRYRVLKEEEDV